MSDSKGKDDGEDDDATAKRSNCSTIPRVADDDDWDLSSIPEPHPGIRRSKQILQQLRDNEKEGLHRIAALAATETATIPDLTISESKLTRGWAQANQKSAAG